MKYAPASLLAAFLALPGCAMTSGVMEGENGVYLISASAAPAAGGSAGAQQAAHEEAKKYCAAKGRRPIVVDAKERDVYQSAAGGSFNQYGGGFAGGTYAAGRATLAFRCIE